MSSQRPITRAQRFDGYAADALRLRAEHYSTELVGSGDVARMNFADGAAALLQWLCGGEPSEWLCDVLGLDALDEEA